MIWLTFYKVILGIAHQVGVIFLGQHTDEGCGGQADAKPDRLQHCTSRSTWSERLVLDASTRGLRPRTLSFPPCAVYIRLFLFPATQALNPSIVFLSASNSQRRLRCEHEGIGSMRNIRLADVGTWWMRWLSRQGGEIGAIA